MLEEVQSEGAKSLGCALDNVWVMFHPVESEHYLHRGRVATPEPNSHPPVVIIRANTGRPPEIRKAFARAVAQSIGRGLSIPAEQVWIHYQEMRLEDVWFQEHWASES